MIPIKALVAIVVISSGASGNAAVTFFSQTNNFSVPSGFGSGSQTLTFNLADTATGSVLALSDIGSISITGIINSDGGAWSAQATGSGATFNVRYTTKGWFESAKPIGISGTSSSPNLLNVYQNPSFFLSGGQSSSGSIPTASTGTLGGALANSAFTDFLGAGTFDINIVMSQANDGSSVSPTRNGSVSYSSRPTLTGEVVVTYEIIPEPSALSLLAVGLGGLAMVRSRRS